MQLRTFLPVAYCRLWRELRERGFTGQRNIVRRWLRCRRGFHPTSTVAAARKAPPRLSVRQTVWHILKQTPVSQEYLEEVYQASPEIAVVARLAREFFRIVRKRDMTALTPWFEATGTTALAGFASHLARDRDAVEAALKLPWSQGQVQGQVHRLKLIKRQMYGRASFDLLRLRVLQKV